MQKLVADKQLGAKTGGSGFYKDGEPQLDGEGDPPEELPDLMGVKAVREACLVLEEGVAQARAIDLGMMAGAGMDPRRGILPPLMRCDIEGLDTVLEKMEKAFTDHGERFEPPAILKRLVAQGRLGQKCGQGFFPWPQPSEGFTRRPGPAREARRLRDRVAEQPAGELAVARRDQGDRVGVGDRRGRRLDAARSSSPPPTRCCSARARTSRRSRRWTRRAGAS